MSALNRGRLVVLVGMDGSGKTTILQHLGNQGLCVSSWKALNAVPIPNGKGALDEPTIRYIRGLPYGNYVNHLQPFSRAAFVLSLAFAEYEYLIRPSLDRGTIVTSDSYYIRPLAKELARGKSPATVLHALRGLPDPELVIFLDVSPQVAFDRKRGIVSEHEVMKEGTFPDFASFQREVDQLCKGLTCGMRTVTIDADRSACVVAAEVRQIVEAECG
jgi:dTMP kinase